MAAKTKTRSAKRPAKRKPMKITAEKGGPPVLMPHGKPSVPIAELRRAIIAVKKEREKAGKAP